MKPNLFHLFAASVAAGAVTLAGAAAAPSFVNEPIASPVAASNADPILAQIADALNSEASLKGSKITVMLDDNGSVLLVGASGSREQATRASEVAAGVAPQRVIANAIQADGIASPAQRPS